MRFGSRLSRPRAIRDEFLEVQGEVFDDGLEAARCGGGAQKPAADLALDFVDGLGAIDFVGRFGVQAGVGGDVGGQGIEVVANGLGAEVLAGGVPGQTGGMLQSEPMFDSFEGFLHSPSAVIQVRKRGGRKGSGVEQGRHHHMHAPVGRHYPHQTNRGRCRRAFIVGGILRTRGRQGDYLLAQAGQSELAHGLEAIGDITTCVFHAIVTGDFAEA